MDNLYASLEEKYGLPTGILSTVRQVESGGNTKAVSPKGARGDFQFMPDTAKAYNVDVNDPVSSAHGAARYLADLIKQHDSVSAALAHYNGGSKAGEIVAKGGEAPYKETKEYVEKVHKGLRIDPSKVQWDEEKIDPSKVQWESAPIDKSQVKWDAKEEPKKTKEEPSNTELFAKGLTKSVVDLGLGAKQILDMPAQFLEKQFPAVSKFGKTMGFPTAEESAKQTEKAVEEERRASLPMMNTLPGQAGYLAGNIGQMALGGAGLKAAGSALNLARPVVMGEALANPATYGTASTVGALQGALQPVTSEESRTFNTLAGGTLGAAGLGAVNTLGRIAQPVQEAIAPQVQKAVDVLRKAGVPLDAAQATGSALLARAKTILDSNPLTTGFEQKSAAEQQSAFNKAVLNTIGSDASAADSTTMGNAAKRIRQVFKDVLNNNDVTLKDDVVSQIAKIQEKANDAEKKPIVNLANRIFKTVDEKGQISGQNAYDIKKDLELYAGNTQDTTLAHYARQLRTTLMNAINDSLPDAEREAFTQARSQFRNMKTIEAAIDKEGTGNISPARLATILGNKSNRAASIYGQGDQSLVELAQSGNLLLRDKTPNSGTIARGAALLLPGVATSALTGMYTGDYQTAAEAGLAGVIAPKLLQKGIRSDYLEKGLSSTPLRNMLQLPKNIGVQKAATPALNAYIQSLPPEQPYRVELSNMLPNRP